MISINNTELFIARALKLVLFLIPFIPLYISPSLLYPYISGKNFAFRIMIELSAALWIVLIYINKTKWFRSSNLGIAILCFAFIAGIADMFGVNPYNSFWSNYERMDGYITILHLVVYFMLLRNIFKTGKDWAVFLNLHVIVGVLVSIYALVQEPFSYSRTHIGWEYSSRISGSIGNPPFLAAYLLLTCFLGVYLMIKTKRPVLKYLYVLPIGLNLWTIYRSATRGAILAVILGVMLLISVPAFIRSNFSVSRAVKWFVIFILILCSFFLAFHQTEILKHDQTLSRFDSLMSSGSVENRLNIWGMAWNAIKERPLLGWGQENLSGIYTVNVVPLRKDHIWIDRAHNIIIEWLLNAGLLGLLSYLSIFVTAVYILIEVSRKKIFSRNEAAVVSTILVVYFFQNLFTFDTINSYMVFFGLLAYIDSRTLMTERDDPVIFDNSLNLKKVLCVIFAALLGFSFCFYYINYKPIRQSQEILRISLSTPENDSYTLLLNELKSALSIHSFGDPVIRERMRAVSDIILSKKDMNKPGAVEFIQTSLEELWGEIEANIQDPEYMMNLVMLYNKIAVYDRSFIGRSEALINRCIQINPDYHRFHLAMSELMTLKHDYEGAFVTLKKIAEKDEQNELIQIKLAQAAILALKEDEVDLALNNLRRILKSRGPGIENILSFKEIYEFAQLYMSVNNYPKAIMYLNETIRILSDMNNPLHKHRLYRKPEFKAKCHFELALMYLKVGEIENAIKEAGIAAGTDPVNYARKAEDIIAEHRVGTR